MIIRWQDLANRAAYAAAVLLLMTATGRAIAQEAGEEAAAAMEQGQTQLTAGEFENAEESFSNAVRLTNGSPTAYLGRAMARKELENYAGAQEDLRNAQQYGVNDPATLGMIKNLSGEINLELGAFAEAMDDLTAAVESNPQNPLFQFNIGKLYAMAGAPNQAIDPLTKWLDAPHDNEEMSLEDIAEKNVEAYRLRGESQFRMGKNEEALGDIAAALAIDPDAYQAYAVKGMILGAQEKYDDAAAALKQAIAKYKPEEDSDLPYIEGRLQRAAVLEEAGKSLTDDPVKSASYYEEERAECEQLLEELPDRAELGGAKAAALFRLGVSERLLGNNNEAVKAFSDAIDLNPTLAQAYFRRGICYFHMGEERMAIDDFNQASSIDFQSPHAALWKGRTYAQLGEFYEAIKAYGEALAVSDRYTDAYVNRGLTYIHLGEYDRAIDDFNDAIRLQPTQADNWYYRGVAYALLDEHERAIKSLANAIKLNPDHAAAHLRLASELATIGQAGLATQYRARGEELSNHVSQ